MCNSLRAGFGFLPVPTVVTDVVGCRRIPQFPGEMLRQNLCLSDIGEIVRFIGGVIVIQFGRNISVLLLNPGIEFLSAVPNGRQFLLFQRRDAFIRFFHEALESGVIVTVLFDDATCKTGHGGITAAFGNDLVAAVRAAAHIGIEVIPGQILTEGHLAGENLHLWFCRAEEESGGIQSLGIEIRENGVDQLLHFAVCRSIRHIINGKQHMELGTGGFAVFLTHIEATVVNGKGNAGKSRLNISRSNPIGGIIGVVIVTVHGETVRAEEVFSVAVMVHILGAHIVTADGSSEIRSIPHFRFVRIGAVAWCVDKICTVKGEHGLYLLASIGEVTQAVVLPLGSADFCFHAGGDAVTKDPHLAALAHQGISEEQS